MPGPRRSTPRSQPIEPHGIPPHLQHLQHLQHLEHLEHPEHLERLEHPERLERLEAPGAAFSGPRVVFSLIKPGK